MYRCRWYRSRGQEGRGGPSKAATDITPTCASSLVSVASKVGKMLPADSIIRLRLATTADVALARVLMSVARAEYCKSLLLTCRVVQVDDTVGDTDAIPRSCPPVMLLLPPEEHDDDDDDVKLALLLLAHLLTPASKEDHSSVLVVRYSSVRLCGTVQYDIVVQFSMTVRYSSVR